MSKGAPVPVMGINLRREGDHAIVAAEREDGTLVDLIREPFDAPFSHHVSEHGIRRCFADLKRSPSPTEETDV